MKNNLFNWATGELSQDAFICWLMSYAMKDSQKDDALKACAQEFLRLTVPQLKDKDISVNKIECQVAVKNDVKRGSIDILLTVNNIYKIIIEDKTYTSEHDNQLQFYKDAITAKYPEYIVAGIYYKTGFQSDYTEVKREEYCQFGLAKIVALLKNYVDNTDNMIFKNYYEYLNDLQEKSGQFKTLPLKDWDWQQAFGFFSCLKTQLALKFDNGKPKLDVKKSEEQESILEKYGFEADFDYVYNQSGGFYAMWISKKCNYVYSKENEQIKYEIYLMMQFMNNEMNICLKLGIKEIGETGKLTPSDIRNKLVYNDKWKYKLTEYNYNKPARFGYGKDMTIGIYAKNGKYENYEQIITDLRAAMQGFDKLTEEICIGEKYAERQG